MSKHIENYSSDVLKRLRDYESLYGSGKEAECKKTEDYSQTGGYLPVFYEYGNQVGGYLPVFYERGYDDDDQDGHGLWSNIWGFVKPFLMKGTKAAAETALSSAGGYINDLIDGAHWKVAGKDRLKEVGNNLTDKLINNVVMKGGGRKRRLALEELDDNSNNPASKVRRIIEEIEKKEEDKKGGPQKKLFSILPPPEKKGRDLRVKKQLHKRKLKRAKRASARIAAKKVRNGRVTKTSQKGKGFDCWL
jgi:hypothetical protein